MRFFVRAVDRAVRKLSGVFEYCDDPDCVFRVSLGPAPYPLPVPGGEVHAGEKVIELHFWNEHLPAMPADGPLIGPAVKLRRQVASSARRLAHSMRNDPRLAGAKAVGGITPLFTAGDNSAAEGIFIRLGFSVTPHRNRRGRFMEFWEEVYAWLLMWAFTSRNQPRRSLRGLRRSDFWISAEDFLRLYGKPSKGSRTDDSIEDEAHRSQKQDSPAGQRSD
jgi:hypothetical protein